jgi:hypothetical protein
MSTLIKQVPQSNKRNEHIIWKQRLDAKIKDTEDYIKYGKRDKIDPIMSQIDEEKYPLVVNKNSNNESIKDNLLKKDNKSSEQLNKHYLPFAENVLAEMKAANKDIIVENAKFVIKNASKAMIEDKKLKYINENSNFNPNFQTYKYINDKLLPQIIHSGLKKNQSSHLKKLKYKAEIDPKIKKYCREIEEKIEKDIELKLSSNYYEKKNKDLEKIFSTNKLEVTYGRKFRNKQENKKESKSKNLKESSSSYDKRNNLQLNSTNRNIETNSNSVSISNKRKNFKKNKNLAADKKKSLKSVDLKSDFEKVYKDTLDNIFQAIDANNISKYIQSPFEESKGKYIF